VLFVPTFQLVRELLAAKRDLVLHARRRFLEAQLSDRERVLIGLGFIKKLSRPTVWRAERRPSGGPRSGGGSHHPCSRPSRPGSMPNRSWCCPKLPSPRPLATPATSGETAATGG
jgi:hypothetical protein